MKKNFVITFFLIPILAYCQKYFLLDSLKENFLVKEYTLKTKELYKVDREVKVYNVFLSKNNILLLSVLPNLDSQDSWTAINTQDFVDKVLSKNEILNLATDWIDDNNPDKKTLNYNLIKKENDKYYISNTCLIEIFCLRDYKYPFSSHYGVINLNEKKVSIKEMQKAFLQQFPSEDFIMDVRNNNRIKNVDHQYLFKNYISKKYKIKNQYAYQFWKFDGWWITDGYNYQRGIDRFVYIPSMGIVGGSYDFYFELKPKISSNNYYTISRKDLWDNIINEKVMIAEELK